MTSGTTYAGSRRASLAAERVAFEHAPAPQAGHPRLGDLTYPRPEDDRHPVTSLRATPGSPLPADRPMTRAEARRRVDRSPSRPSQTRPAQSRRGRRAVRYSVPTRGRGRGWRGLFAVALVLCLPGASVLTQGHQTHNTEPTGMLGAPAQVLHQP